MQPEWNPPATDPDFEVVSGIIDGFRASKAVFTAISLGVFDYLHTQPATSEQLAEALHCPADPLERILGACTALQLLEIENGVYRNQRVAERFLRIQSPDTLAGYLLYSDRILYRLWSHLEGAVREGTHRWEQEFGSKENIFEHFFATESEKLSFLAGMHGAGLLSSPVAVRAFDLSQFTQLTDLGGGTGHLVIEACRTYPTLQGTLFDLPAVIPVAERYIAAAGLQERIRAIGGDFFRDPLPPGDLYSMGRILHDWSEEKVRSLLHKVCQQLPDGGGLLICEKLLYEGRDGPASAYLQSLNMLVCTEGKERSASEYEELVRGAGFRSFQARKTGQHLDVMLAEK